MPVEDESSKQLDARRVHFLRAEHAFDASTLTDPVSLSNLGATCLSFDAGDMVFQHLVHSSGWADVTLVKTFERGWVPAEYFTNQLDPRAYTLLAAAGRFLAQPRSHRLPGAAQYTFSETSINNIISGTKQLLDELSTLSRDSALVVKQPTVAQARKAILTELAHLVHVARNNPRSTNPDVIGKLMRGVYRLIERMQDLLAACDAVDYKEASPASLPAEDKNGPPSVAVAAEPSGPSQAPAETPRPGDAQADAPVTPRPLSFIDHISPPDPESRLQEVTAAFIAYLSEFEQPDELLADPSNPSTSTAILALTRRCMLSCRELLAVLDVHPTAFEDVKDELLESIRRLVGAARSIVAVLPPAPVSLTAVATQNLVFVAEKCHELCIRAGNECLVLLRANPGLELSPNRSYPIFPSHEPVLFPLEPKRERRSKRFSAPMSPFRALSPTRPPTTPRHSRNSSLSSPRSPRTPHARSKSVEPGQFDEEATPVVGSVPPLQLTPSTRNDPLGLELPASISAQTASPNRRTVSMPENTFAKVPKIDLEDIEQELVLRNNAVRGGTFRALVAYLCNGSAQFHPSELEIRSFLLCYRLFSTPGNFVAALFMARDAGAQGVSHVVSIWLSRFWCPEDESMERDAKALTGNPEGVDAVTGPLSTDHAAPSDGDGISAPLFLLEEATEAAFVRAVPPQLEWIVPTSSRDPIDLLLSVPAEKISEQLTLVWFEIFSKINAFELIDQRFSRKSQSEEGLAPNVNELIQSSNRLSAFIGDTMLAENLTMDRRADVLRQWITIAQCLYSLGNLNGAVTITLTLGSDRIFGLARTWAQLETRVRGLYDRLRPLVLPDRNFGEYRREIRRRIGSSCIPFLGLVLGDLVLIDEGNPKLLEPTRAINFDRYVKTCKVIASVQTFQARPFALVHDLPLQAALLAEMAKSHKRESIDEEDQWRRSQLIQRRESKI